jgi:hypothetical protein
MTEKRDALSRASLVHRNHLLETKDIVHDFFKPIEALATGIQLVAAHQRRPLDSG